MKRVISIIIMLLCIIGIIYSVFKLFERKVDIDENNNIEEKLEEFIRVEEEPIVDFKKIKEQNNDAIAYIEVSNTDIKYVVVRGSDNNYYLRHNFDKQYNVAGWIFADYRNKFDGTDKNIVIYGHNMSDGSMFGSLSNALNSDWQNKDEEVLLVTENNTYKYKVFSVYVIEPEEYYINTYIDNDFINVVANRSYHDFGVSVDSSDSILTLSTCTSTGKERIVLHAIKSF